MLTGDLMAQLDVCMLRSVHSRHNQLARMGL